MASRTIHIATAIAAAVVSGAVLFATAPPTSLVDAPMNQQAEAGGELDSDVVPELSDFYDTPMPDDAEVGQLFAAEPVDGAPDDVKLYRILYVSTDLQNNKIPVSGIYAAPSTGSGSEGDDSGTQGDGFPLVSFAHGTLGVGRPCGISQTPLQPRTPGYTAWVPHIKPLVDAGLAVVGSDYSGMGAPGPSSYLVGPLEGRGILDAMRAVQNPSPLTGDIPIDTTKLAVYGKSQGGEAANSALQLAPDYAPDLDIASGVLLAPGYTPPIRGLLDTVVDNPTSTTQNMFVLLIARSYAESYPHLVSLDDILTPEGVEKAKLLDTYCAKALTDQVSDVPLNQLVKTPVSGDLIRAMSMAMPGTKRIPTPIGIWQGLEDVTIIPQFTHAQVMSQCALGTTTFYVRYPDDDHGSMNYQAREHQPSAIDYMKNIWDGEPAPDNCANRLLGTLNTAPAVN